MAKGSLMKKLFFLISLILIFVTNAGAGPSFLGPDTVPTSPDYDSPVKSYTKDGITYDIVNRSRPGDSLLLGDPGYSNSDFTGYYIGTVIDDNDDPSDILNLARLFFNDNDFVFSGTAKTEVDNGLAVPENMSDPYISIIFDAWKDNNQLEPIGGSWTLVNAEVNQEISFYTVKGADEYALYFVDPVAITGSFITDHVLTKNGNIPALSHFTGAITIGETTGEPPHVIPEPGTMMLLGLGLLGFAGVVRRKINA